MPARPVTDARVAEILRKRAEALPGEWRMTELLDLDGDVPYFVISSTGVGGRTMCVLNEWGTTTEALRANAVFIASAHDACDLIVELQAENRHLRELTIEVQK